MIMRANELGPNTSQYRHFVLERLGDICVVRLGPQTLEEVQIQEFGDDVLDLIERQGCRRMAIVFGPLDCLYSVFLGKLMTIRNRMVALGGELRLCEVPELAREVFRVCRLEEYFQFRPRLSDVLREWGVTDGPA